MPALSLLIPAEFKTACPRLADATHGCITLTRDGRVLVEWKLRTPCFAANLEVARGLKNEGFGTYRPNDGGWVFHRNAAELVHERFPATLVRSPEFVALTTAPDGKTSKPAAPVAGAAPTAPASKPHGRITLTADKRAFVVAWGGAAGFAPAGDFARYLQAARNLKADYAGQRGWDKNAGGWVFNRNLAASIVRLFTAATFTHCPELAADAAVYPEAAAPVAAPAVPKADPLAAKLLDAADDLFDSFE